MNLYDAVETLGMRWPNNGKLNCPLHVDKTPSLHLYADTNSWTCFACQENGDHYGLLAAYLKGDMTKSSMAAIFKQYGDNTGDRVSQQTQDLVGPQAMNTRMKRMWSDLNAYLFDGLRALFSDYHDDVYLAEIERMGEYLDDVKEYITSSGAWDGEPLPPLREVREVLDATRAEQVAYLQRRGEQLEHGTYKIPEEIDREASRQLWQRALRDFQEALTNGS